MKLFSEDIIILRVLMERFKVPIYDFHKNYKLTPTQIFRSLNKFSINKIIEYDEINAKITEFGKDWINANRRFIYLKKFEYICSYDTNLHSGKRVEIDELYKPKISDLKYILYKEGE